jgi:hypothetical protein
VRDVAKGGMFIHGQAPQLGAEVTVRLLTDSTEVKGRVVRHAEIREPEGFAIELLRPYDVVENLIDGLGE